MYVIEPRSQVGPREGVKHINIDVVVRFLTSASTAKAIKVNVW